MPKLLRILLWSAVAALGAAAIAVMALHRGESINAAWLVVAAVCTYAVAYRFYARFLALRLFLAHAAMIRDKLASGQLPPGAKSIADAQRMLFNDRLDAVIALAFMAVAVLVIVVSVREWLLVLRHRKPAVLREAPFVPSALVAGD